jgi:opacity protein-like surface antigen
MASLGNGFYFGDCTIEADLMYKHLNYEGQNHELSAVAKVGYTLKDKVELFVKGGYEYRTGFDIFGYDDEFGFIPTDASSRDYLFYGIGANYYPLKSSKDLRLHAIVATNNYAKSIALSIGATYHFNLTDTICKSK